jgi:hypothetical protein
VHESISNVELIREVKSLGVTDGGNCIVRNPPAGMGLFKVKFSS